MMERYVVRHGRHIAVETLKTSVITGRRRQRADPFVTVPLAWIEQATRATTSPKAFVAIWLLYLAWKTKSRTFPLPNGALRQRGVSRLMKYRALHELETAGLIQVEQRRRQTPIVTLIGL
jgi:hypothetical protein